ncbi:MAG TPA: hypothetical protein VFO83_10430, partial [Aggregicoccus sp.]|nr:hypothetical protein [Aggregicoccus sp.]
MKRAYPWPGVGLLLPALLWLLVQPGCATRNPPLYAGDNPRARTEHVFQYPLPEALAAVSSLLATRDYEAIPFADGRQLLTRWRLNGRSLSGYTNTAYLRRYYVQGLALGPHHSVVRVFRIDREEPYQPGQTPSELVYAAQLAPKTRKKGNVEQGRVEDAAAGGWRNFVAAGLETDRRLQESAEEESAQDEREKKHAAPAGGTGTNFLGGPTRTLMGDPRFQDQFMMTSQDELRGASERGVRDRELERELVQRLEQFASLEFTGGAYDVPAPPGKPDEPPVTRDWELEDGGTPFSGPAPCGQPIAGLGPLSRPGLTILVGEQLGTREVPAAVGNMACELAQVGRSVLLGLAMPRTEQQAVDAYVRSEGQYEDLEALLAGEFWRQVPRDGRSSRALVVLLERVRRWRAGGLDIQPIAYDAPDTKGNTREEAMAALLLKHRRERPRATLLVLGGNYHVRSQDGAPWSSFFEPLGFRLARQGVPLYSLDTAFSRGQRWACAVNRRVEPECRVYATSPSDESYSPPGRSPGVQLFKGLSDAGFHGVLHVGALSPSLPAVPTREQRVAARPGGSSAGPDAEPAALSLAA